MTSHAKPARPRLGRGLSSLIVNSAEEDDDKAYQHVTGLPPVGHVPAVGEVAGKSTDRLVDVPVDQIGPNPYQPRQAFNEDDLAALAESIQQQGVLQPLVLAPSTAPHPEHPYVLVAGERRLRAAKRLGRQAVPCVVREATPQQMLEWALVENLQRTDLNPIERAEAYRSYVDRFDLTHAQAAERLGQPRPTVTNYLRLLDLQLDVQAMIASGELSFGHAKVLAGLLAEPQRQLALARRAARDQLSVRELERLAAEPAAGAEEPPRRRPAPEKPPYLRDIEEQLCQAVGTRVAVRPGRRKHTGRVVIDYYSLDDFDRIVAALGVALES